jgi:glycosyltransferase involved in cell wall biosynthesis
LKYNVLNIADFSAASAGNFICSLKALKEQISKDGGKFIWVFPFKAESRSWSKELIESGEKVYFTFGNIKADSKLFKKLISEYDINIAHTHFADSGIYVPLRLACASKKIKIVVHVHSNFHKENSFLKNLIKRTAMGADMNICVSSQLCETVKKAGFKNAVTVSNAVDFKRLDKYEGISKADLNIPEEKIILMSFGYDFKIKGIDVLLDALDNYDVNNKYVLLLCAAGHTDEAEKQIIERYGNIPANVRIMPSREDIASYYKLADIFVAASRAEGFSYARVEAAYCLVPEVLSDIPVHHQGNIPHIRYFISENPQALYIALDDTLKNTDDLYDAKKYVINEYGMDKWTDNIIKVYDSLF